MTAAPAPSLPELLDDGLRLFAGQVASVTDADWRTPTACDGWTVRELVGHVVGVLDAGVAILSGRTPHRDGDPAAALGDDDALAITARVERLADELRSALAGADLGATRDTPMGPRTIADGLAFPIVDLAVHSCDLARALGREIDIPADLLAYADAFSRSVPQEVTRRPGVFGPEVPAPADATPTQRLLAFLGRPAPTADVWARLAAPEAPRSEGGDFGWVGEQVARIEAAGTTDAVGIQGMKVVLLTMLGKKSGQPRKVPLMRVEHGGVYAAVASKGGAPDHPQWYHNLVATPELLLQDSSVVTRRRARLITGDERAQWWERCVAAFPPYAEYVVKAGDRVIPVFLLEPADDTPGRVPAQA